jgi:hypothetical protein
MAGEECGEANPSEPLAAGSSFQPFPPQPPDLGAVSLQLPHVPRDAVVGIMTFKLRSQPVALPAQQVMPVGPTPLIDCD